MMNNCVDCFVFDGIHYRFDSFFQNKHITLTLSLFSLQSRMPWNSALA